MEWQVIGAEQVLRRSAWLEIEASLRARGVSLRCWPTSDANSLRKKVEQLVGEGATHFVAVGGDGAANLLVDALLEHVWEEPPHLALLPFGTACDFARCLGIPRAPYQSAELLVDKPASEPILGKQHVDDKLCDVAIVSGEWGSRHLLNVASFGLTALTARRASKLRWLGLARYLISFWSLVPWARKHTFTIHGRNLARGQDVKQTLSGILVVVANGRFFGGGFEIAPTATIDDGLVDVVTVSASRWQAINVFQKVLRRIHLKSRLVEWKRLEEVELSSSPPSLIEIDGEILGMTPAKIRVLPSAIRVRGFQADWTGEPLS